MQILKFRAIDISDNLIYFTFEQIPNVLPNIIKGTVEQYIDREDEDGLELYEGDIVQGYDVLYKYYFKGVISFQDSSFIIRNEYCSYYRWTDYKVWKIGDRYTNKKLYRQAMNNE